MYDRCNSKPYIGSTRFGVTSFVPTAKPNRWKVNEILFIDFANVKWMSINNILLTKDKILKNILLFYGRVLECKKKKTMFIINFTK